MSFTRPGLARPLGALALIALSFALWTPPESHASCFPWKCCDAWGYDQPGVYLRKTSCEADGGLVHCGLSCPAETSAIFKCCEPNGDPTSGVYAKRHDCKAAGKEVFEGVLLCPGGGAFQCCDPEGGSAPGVFLTRHACSDAGWVVQDFKATGCPGSFFYTVKQALRSRKCAEGVRAEFLSPGGRLERWIADYDATHADRWSDKDSHCTISCVLASRCGRLASSLAGFAKEVQDVFDGTPHNAFGHGDACANRIGRRYGMSLPFDAHATNPAACHAYCTGYPALETRCDGPLSGLRRTTP